MGKLLATVITAALLSACGQSAPTTDNPASSTDSAQGQQFANWPATLNDFRFRWTAAPGIDLTKGPSVLIRAYLESYEVAEYTFDIAKVYPGFLRATPPNADTDAPGALMQHIGIRPLGYYNTKTPGDARPHFGFLPFHVLELAPFASGWEATVCTAEYGSFIESTTRPGKFISLATDDKTGKPPKSGPTVGVYVYRIEFTEHDPRVGLTPPQSPNVPQMGPSPAPAIDVFGNWFVTAESIGFWGPVGQTDKPPFPSPELEQRCADSMPQNEAERTAMMTGYKDTPPAHGDPVPGWPQQSN
ncbi:hypothetical protein [Mycolicibacterium hodleri]|uniref:Lipoprotein n=1 Tax=Mycolicibacterium hodleri TaxID=49897 RepID=A0A502EHN0_9MYCO|nr:hypothetical protein [Mycolicibacterium hodleri]TPG36006.1 hypothetical protein EAH80_08315 [Mycolicibacterium hodleri]